MSSRLAMPNRPAKLGRSKEASGMPTGEVAGSSNTAQPYMPASRKKDVAVKKPAIRLLSPR